LSEYDGGGPADVGRDHSVPYVGAAETRFQAVDGSDARAEFPTDVRAEFPPASDSQSVDGPYGIFTSSRKPDEDEGGMEGSMEGAG